MSAGAGLSDAFDTAGLAPRFRAKPDSLQVVEVTSKIGAGTEAQAALLHAVASNTPCVFRGLLQDWRPVQAWSDEHLRERCGDRQVPVRRHASGSSYGDPRRESIYGPPHQLSVSELLGSFSEAQAQGASGRFYAAQLQLRTHLPELFAEALPGPADALCALGRLWRESPSLYMGCGASTPLHFDLLENLLCVVRGRKRLTLWHPADAETLYPGGGGNANFSMVPHPLDLDDPAFPLLREADALEVSC